MMDTGKRPNPRHAESMPIRSAAHPASGVVVASVMAGKVMTASVTYGT